MQRFLISCIFLVLINYNSVLLSQESMEFSHVTSEEGLSQNTIFCMLQDRDGFVWIGTRDGLNRYNGYDVTVFQTNKEDSTSISNNRILCLAEDEEGKVWVGTTDGLNVYDKDQQHFIRTKTSDLYNPLNNSIYALTLDADKQMWIGTDGGGILVYDASSGNYQHLEEIVTSDVDIKQLQVRSIIETSTGEIWISTLRQGLFIYNKKLNSIENITVAQDNTYGLPSNSIRTLHADKDGNVWIGSEKDGCTRYNTHTHEIKHFSEDTHPAISNNVVRAIQEGPDGTMWIGTLSGMNGYNPKTNSIKVYTSNEMDDRSLSNKSIRSFLYDQRGNMWVGTYYGGINIHYNNRANIHFSDKPFSNVETNNYGIVSSFAEEGNGTIWIGTENRGLYRYDALSNTIKEHNSQHIKDEVIKSLYFEQPSTLWIGTYGGGLYILDTSLDVCTNYKTDNNDSLSISSNNIYTVLRDSKERIWVGTSAGGLNLFDPIKKTFKVINPTDEEGNILIGNTINDIKEGPNGHIWIASVNEGLIRYDGQAFTDVGLSIINPCEANFSNIRTIHFDSWGNLWAGSELGLFCYDVEEHLISHYDRTNGLAGNSICGILEDSCSNLWISGINGITKFPMSEYYPLPYKEDTLISIFTSKDGLQGNEFNLSACRILPDNSLMFGGINGFNRFLPLTVQQEQEDLKVTFEALYVLNTIVIPSEDDEILQKHIRNTSDITLTNSQSSFSFEYVALNFDHSEHTQYTYKLKGFDDDWVNAGTSRKAIYTKVPPGEYTFMVKAGNSTDIWNSNIAHIDVKVLRPLWKSSLAIGIYTVVFLLLILFYTNWLTYNRKQRKLLEDERNERLRIKEMDDMKSEFFANVSHQFRTPLTLIAGPIEKLRDAQELPEAEKSHLISLMDRNVTRLQQLISQLMDFSRYENKMMKIQVSKGEVTAFVNEIYVRFEEFFKQKNLKVKVISQTCEAVWFDKRVIENIISIVLSNATKYTPKGGHISIEIENTPKLTSIIISNTGSTIPPVKLAKIFNRFYSEGEHSVLSEGGGTGIGLSFAKNLILLHQGDITAESANDLTTFTISFPNDKESYHSDEISTDIPTALVNKPSTENTEETTVETKDQTLLIVEDEMELRTFIKSQFADYKVYEAENGKEGFKLAKKHIPDLIISDVMMPIMDGIELCKSLKNHLSTNHIPLILLTAKTAVDHRIEGTDSGADLYMDKPFVVSVLRANVSNLLEQRKRLEERFSSTPSEEEDSLYKGEDKLVQQAQAIIKDRVSDPKLNVEDLAKELLLSRSQLFRKFKAVSSYSPNEFIKVTRLKYALELLLKGELNVTEISYDCGFSSPSLFITTFKKHYGKTPKEYIKDLKQKSE